MRFGNKLQRQIGLALITLASPALSWALVDAPAPAPTVASQAASAGPAMAQADAGSPAPVMVAPVALDKTRLRDNAKTFDALMRLQRDTALAEAKAALAKAQDVARQASPAKSGRRSDAPNRLTAQLLGVIGVGQALRATLVMNGANLQVGSGDVIGDGWTIKSIGANGVMVVKGTGKKQQRQVLTLSDGTPPPPPPQAAPNMASDAISLPFGMMPPPPPGAGGMGGLPNSPMSVPMNPPAHP